METTSAPPLTDDPSTSIESGCIRGVMPGVGVPEALERVEETTDGDAAIVMCAVDDCRERGWLLLPCPDMFTLKFPRLLSLRTGPPGPPSPSILPAQSVMEILA